MQRRILVLGALFVALLASASAAPGFCTLQGFSVAEYPWTIERLPFLSSSSLMLYDTLWERGRLQRLCLPPAHQREFQALDGPGASNPSPDDADASRFVQTGRVVQWNGTASAPTPVFVPTARSSDSDDRSSSRSRSSGSSSETTRTTSSTDDTTSTTTSNTTSTNTTTTNSTNTNTTTTNSTTTNTTTTNSTETNTTETNTTDSEDEEEFSAKIEVEMQHGYNYVLSCEPKDLAAQRIEWDIEGETYTRSVERTYTSVYDAKPSQKTGVYERYTIYHSFSGPGTYEVSCAAVGPEGTASASGTVEVEAEYDPSGYVPRIPSVATLEVEPRKEDEFRVECGAQGFEAELFRFSVRGPGFSDDEIYPSSRDHRTYELGPGEYEVTCVAGTYNSRWDPGFYEDAVHLACSSPRPCIATAGSTTIVVDGPKQALPPIEGPTDPINETGPVNETAPPEESDDEEEDDSPINETSAGNLTDGSD